MVLVHGRECYGMSRGSRVVYTAASKFRSATLDVTLKASLLLLLLLLLLATIYPFRRVLFPGIILGRPNSLRRFLPPLIISGKCFLRLRKTSSSSSVGRGARARWTQIIGKRNEAWKRYSADPTADDCLLRRTANERGVTLLTRRRRS